MSSAEKRARVLCTCVRCGPQGTEFSDRSYRRHIDGTIDQAKVANSERPTKLQMFLANPYLHQVIAGSFTLLMLVIGLMSIKSDHPTMPNSAFDAILSLISTILDHAGLDSSIIPKTYDSMVTILKPVMPDFDEIVLCDKCGKRPNPMNREVNECGIEGCKHPIYDNNYKPIRRIYVQPIIPWLKELMATNMFAQLVRDPENLAPISKFSAVKDCCLAPDNRLVLRLLFSTDGACPWSAYNSSYSVWPGTIEILNLPVHLRRDPRFTLLAYLSPGPKKPSTMNSLLEVLTNELQILADGVCMFDAHLQKKMVISAKLEIVCADWPAFCALRNIPHATAIKNACPYCSIEGVHDRALSKQVFETDVQNVQLRDPIDYDHVRSLITLGQTDNAEEYISEFGPKSVEQFALLPYFDSLCYAVDFMHLCKNIVHRIYKVLTGDFKDSVLQHELLAGRFTDKTQFSMSRNGLKVATERLRTLVIPKGKFHFPDKLFCPKTAGHLKSHTWLHIFTEGILCYCTTQQLPLAQSAALCNLRLVIKKLLSPNIDPASDFDALSAQLLCAVDSIQKTFPRHLFTLQLHVLIHTVAQLKRFGPPSSYWMFASERFMHYLMTRCQLNHAASEVTAINNYKVAQVTTLLRLSMGNINQFGRAKLFRPSQFVPAPDEGSAIVAAWNTFVKRDKALVITDKQSLDQNSQFYEALETPLFVLRKHDYILVNVRDREFIGKVINLCDVKFGNSVGQFILLRCFKPKLADFYHIDGACERFVACHLIDSCKMSKPLVYFNDSDTLYFTGNMEMYKLDNLEL